MKIQRSKKGTKEGYKYVVKMQNENLSFLQEAFYSGKFYYALECLKDYIRRYPSDEKAMFLYGKYLRLMNLKEEAYVFFTNNFDKLNKYFMNGCLEFMFLLIDLEQYEEAFKYYNTIKEEEFKTGKYINGHYIDFSNVRIFLMEKMGIYIPTVARDAYDYLDRQIIEYDERDFFNNLAQHQNGEGVLIEENRTFFDEQFDVFALYLKINDFIQYADVTPNYSVFKTFVFEVPGVGYDMEGKLGYVTVLALEEEEELRIVRMAPYRLTKYPSHINTWKELEIRKINADVGLKLERNH